MLGSWFLAALGGMAVEVRGFGKFVRGGRLGFWVLGFGFWVGGLGSLAFKFWAMVTPMNSRDLLAENMANTEE